MDIFTHFPSVSSKFRIEYAIAAAAAAEAVAPVKVATQWM